MTDDASPQGPGNAGLYLRFLLKEPYRHRWYRPDLVERVRQSDVHHAAVAQVLAAYLRRHPRRPEDRKIDARSLEPLVSRALRGETLSKQTLEIFIEAFGIVPDHADSLWWQWRGQERGQVVVGSLAPPESMPNYQTREYDILMLHEHHWLGAHGLPVRHRTQVNIRSRVDGLRVYQYRFDTHLADVRVPRNHGAEIGPIYQVGEGIYAVDFQLDRPLGIGESDYLEFWTILRYKEPPPREMRRGTHERIEHLYLRVAFDTQKLPSKVWWAEWLDYQGANNRITKSEPYTLDDRLFVHRHLKPMERAVVGFTWAWQ